MVSLSHRRAAVAPQQAGQDGNRQFSPPGGAEGVREGREEGGSTNAALLIAQYVSIITLFAAATFGVVMLIGKRKKTGQDETAIVPAIIAEPEGDIPKE